VSCEFAITDCKTVVQFYIRLHTRDWFAEYERRGKTIRPPPKPILAHFSVSVIL